MDVTATLLLPEDLERELTVTRRLLERMPDEHFGWKPHEKSMRLGQLGAHLANLLTWNVMALTSDELDLATLPPQDAPPANREALLAVFDAKADAARAAYQGLDASVNAEPWTLRHGDHALFTHPKGFVIRTMVINHLIHHRGQLSVYLRLLDVPLPPMYGPTADERGM